MKDGFIKVAAATPVIRVADCMFNANAAADTAKQAAKQGVHLLVLPELCLTGYTCGDLFLQSTLLEGACCALHELREQTRALDLLVVAGLPVRRRGKIFNCAAVLYHGRVLGVIPKTWLPNYGEFYEKRHFASARILDGKNEWLDGLDEQPIPFGTKLLFVCEQQPDFVLGVEICEDLWSALPPSAEHVAAGATIIANLSASDELIGKDATRRQLVTGQSARLLCGYLYANAGEGESTGDVVFAAHNLIAENGTLLAQTAPFSGGMAITEIDVCRIVAERCRSTTHPEACGEDYLHIPFSIPLTETTLTRTVEVSAFLPTQQPERDEACEMALCIQAHALKKRLSHTGAKTVVLGISGGLDSALALLVAVRAIDLLERPRTDILAVTMPCFGTTSRTKSNAVLLSEGFGVRLMEVDVRAAVELHLRDIGHPLDQQDVTYENAQARERTQVLMDLCNRENGLVLGTGDLSELALGWATYNGDHMSMYGVNAAIPKTMVRHLTAYEAARVGQKAAQALSDILETPVSPELLPPREGEIQQKTEDLVGPYELHDFFLYYLLRWGFSPCKIDRLARYAFGETYSTEVIRGWLRVFVRRFFSQQFKRSCMPDGPKVGPVSLSPRGDWRMPSDAMASLWLAELDELDQQQENGVCDKK